MPMTMTERLDHARAALTSYFEAKGEPSPEGPWDYEDTAASDLIADLLHLQKRLGQRGTVETLRTALLHFEGEEAEGPHYPCALCDCVESDPPKFAGEAGPPETEPSCSSRCQSSRQIEWIDIVTATPQVISIQIQGGLLTDVSGLPAHCELRVEDYDVHDESHPRWNAEKECIVTVYQGG